MISVCIELPLAITANFLAFFAYDTIYICVGLVTNQAIDVFTNSTCWKKCTGADET